MRVIGIDVSGSKAIFVALEQKLDNTIEDITGKFNSLGLGDHKDSVELKRFKNTIFDFFDGIRPDAIAVVAKSTGGQYKGSAISFKIEGLLQSYEGLNVQIVAPVFNKCLPEKKGVDCCAKVCLSEGCGEIGLVFNSKK